MKKIINAVDLFCGAGGESTGLYNACQSANVELDLLAINHWDVAIETHSKNHPYARHMCESIQKIDPTKAVPGGRVNFLWASPECTHHSKARAGRPRSDQSRASAWLVLKWLSELYVDRVIIENVPEFLNWGPLGANGSALQSKKGETFKAFVTALESLGYRVDWKLLCAADYGDPTTRTRLFIQAVRGKNRIAWPNPTHSQQPDMFTSRRWVPARDIIDWSIPGKSIFTRKKPLVDNTLRRIEAGIAKYWGAAAEPFLILLRGTNKEQINSSAFSIDNPLPTVTSGGRHVALIEPFIMASGHSKSIRNRSMSEPLSTIVTKAEHYLVEPFLVKYYGQSHTQSIKDPLGTVTTNDRFAVINGNPYLMDITFRMLSARELSYAQGFPINYWFAGKQNEQVKQIGNAVPCNLARELCAAGIVA